MTCNLPGSSPSLLRDGYSDLTVNARWESVSGRPTRDWQSLPRFTVTQMCVRRSVQPLETEVNPLTFHLTPHMPERFRW